NPLEFAIQGIKASVTCEDQPGQTIDHLFDFDMKAGWHTKWGKGEAVPFDMLIDLRSVNQLDRLDYYHREDGGNGTILRGTVSYSTDKQTWSTPVPFSWERVGAMSTFAFDGNPTARYIKIAISEAVGNFGSGHEMYIFKVADTESILQGDINRDKRIDEGDFTSYMNYTGLRRGDGDFDYVSIGDVNGNGLIDAYDASLVSTVLDGGARPSSEVVAGSLVLTPSAKTYKAGDEVLITVSGKDLRAVNALSFALPYDTQEFEYMGIEAVGMKQMVNLTNDRLHSDGTKALYPTFVNRGQATLLDAGNPELFVIKLKAKRAGRFNLAAKDGLLIDSSLGVVKF
ncbi:MAG: discoidin domain-containing protein, partial [Bacteroidaceae bacterium]|nr:discoidin domain-containing protein [Bacteroidaceae bacterium]